MWRWAFEPKTHWVGLESYLTSNLKKISRVNLQSWAGELASASALSSKSPRPRCILWALHLMANTVVPDARVVWSGYRVLNFLLSSCELSNHCLAIVKKGKRDICSDSNRMAVQSFCACTILMIMCSTSLKQSIVLSTNSCVAMIPKGKSDLWTYRCHLKFFIEEVELGLL